MPLLAEINQAIQEASQERGKAHESLYGFLSRRLDRYEQSLPTEDLRLEFDGEIWEISKELMGVK